MRKIIDDCEIILRLTDEMLSINSIAEAVGISKTQKVRHDKFVRRTGLNIMDVLSTGRDFVLYGEPGAGKTTTLQHFTKMRLDESKVSNIIYVPLSKTVEAVSWNDVDDIDQIHYLQLATVIYLKKQGAILDASILDDLMSENGTSIIYDGLDEVYDKAPWVVSAIKKIRSKFNKLQILISSRTIGPYSNKIESLGLTLLPFTDEQRM